MNGKIRKAKKKEAIRILRLFNSDKNLIGDDNIKYEKRDILDYLGNKLCKIVVYDINKKIVGACLFQFWKTYIYIQTLIIHKKFRGKGIGSLLVSYVENIAKKGKRGTIELFVEANNKNMRRFTEKRDYKKGKNIIYCSKQI